jgi:hypothetical protein
MVKGDASKKYLVNITLLRATGDTHLYPGVTTFLSPLKYLKSKLFKLFETI